MITIRVGDADYTYDATAGDIAGLGIARARSLSALPPGDGQDSNTPISERPGYIAEDEVYLQATVQSWATANNADSAAIQACMERCIRSWSADAPLPPEDAPAEPLSPEAAKAALVVYALNRRWMKEVGGVTINGIRVPTDDRAKLLLLGAAQSMADGSSAPLVVSGVNYGLMSKPQFQAINSAVVAHVQSTFPTLAAVLTDIASGTITSTTAIDGAFA